MIRRAAVLLVTIGALLLAWTGSASAILHGEPDGNAHSYVGLITDGRSVCSGSAISSTAFITAAHCFDRSGEQVEVTFDPQGLHNADAVFHTGRWYPDPQFCLGCSAGLAGYDTHDVAVVLLDEPARLGSYAALPTRGQVDRLPMHQRITLVGYGVQNPLNTLRPGEAFTRYRATAELLQSDNRIAREFLVVSADPAQGKGGSCFGDSGGPILLGRRVLGVNSFVTNRQCAGVTYAYRIDTAAALTFIDSAIAGHA